jgi:peptide/nickel transport system ATP-binding protein
LFVNPIHPYTKALLSAIPIPEVSSRDKKRMILKGEVTSPINLPDQCRFAKRCMYADEKCMKFNPELRKVAKGHYVACHNI